MLYFGHLAYWFLYSPPNGVHVNVVCWYWLQARATYRTLHKGTRCVRYVIPTGVLALMTIIQNHLLHATDARQPSIFVRTVVVLRSCTATLSYVRKCRPFKGFTSSKYQAFAQLFVNSHLVGHSCIEWICPTCEVSSLAARPSLGNQVRSRSQWPE